MPKSPHFPELTTSITSHIGSQVKFPTLGVSLPIAPSLTFTEALKINLAAIPQAVAYGQAAYERVAPLSTAKKRPIKKKEMQKNRYSKILIKKVRLNDDKTVHKNKLDKHSIFFGTVVAYSF